jgi:hypothetical protein
MGVRSLHMEEIATIPKILLAGTVSMVTVEFKNPSEFLLGVLPIVLAKQSQ